MRNFIWILLIVFMIVGLLVNQADARRFGGGKSFGFQRSASSFSRASEPLRPMLSNTTRTGFSKWLGPLAGLAAGGLLAYLFMGHGLGSGLLTWLALAGIGFLIWNWLRNRMQPAVPANLSRENFSQNNISQFGNISQFNPTTTASFTNNATTYPADFDPDTFTHDAKVQFIRLQAAYDSKNLADLREFTAPEVFGEIQLQLQDRGDAPNTTEVVKLVAELLDVQIESQATLASVRFTGLIREEANTDPISINEIWHFRRYSGSSTWVVAGLQQE